MYMESGGLLLSSLSSFYFDERSSVREERGIWFSQNLREEKRMETDIFFISPDPHNII
jgi:hypothetical protein